MDGFQNSIGSGKNHFQCVSREDLYAGSKASNILPRLQKKKPVDFDDELKIGDVWYDNMTKITIKVQLFWRLPYEM